MKMNTVALIPARGGSKRIPGKNLKRLGGKPLIEWSIITAQLCELISKVYVSSNSPVTLALAEGLGAIPINRPPEFATDTSPDLDVVSHFLATFPGTKPDLIAYLRPTTPFRKIAVIDIAIRLFTNMIDGDTPSALRSIEKEPESAWKSFLLEEQGGYLSGIMTSVEEAGQCNDLFPSTFKGNGYIDIIRPETVNRGKAWGKEVFGYLTAPTIELDTPEEWNRAEYELRRKRGGTL